MPDEYYALAENEFLEAVNEYNKKHSVDTAVYKASTDHVWIEDKEVELSVGRRVRLKSQEYFPVTGYRDSRITKITRKVNLPSQMDLEIGDALSRTSMQKLADGISDARSYARTLSMSVALPDIIRTGDSTKPTDYNLLSAKRSVSDFLSRRFADSATGLKKFLDGLDTGNYTPGVSGGHIGAEGDAELETLRLRKSLTLGDYVPGVSGGTFYIDANGEAHIDTAYLTVNKKNDGQGIGNPATALGRWLADKLSGRDGLRARGTGLRRRRHRDHTRLALFLPGDGLRRAQNPQRV